jgi:EAL and modified HD-GYP domain-containing signal transduction protein
MQNHPVLDHVFIGYSPMIDARRSMVATRLTVFPQHSNAPPDAAALVEALVQAFPVPEGDAAAPPILLLNLANEDLLDATLQAGVPPHMLLEVPAFMAGDEARAQRLRALHAQGQRLAIGGRPLAELPRDLLPCFRHAVVDFHDDRRTSAPGPHTPQRSITTLTSGVRTADELETAFARGAVGVLGWPMDDEVTPLARGAMPPDLRAIVELMNRVEREEPAEDMEGVLKADPTLAFRLLRYINSAAFGLRVEVTSFKHALMLLGYQRLKRWLALLLASGTKDASLHPVMHMATRRGLFMEELARGAGDDEMRGEMFVCGVFSLLDKLMRQPFDELMKNVPVPERVLQSLLGEGPYSQHLALVRAVEESSVHDIRATAEHVMVSPGEVNRALLAALSAARQFD